MKFVGLLAGLLGVFISGCSTSHHSAELYGSESMYGDALSGDVPASDAGGAVDQVQQEQMLIWTGSISLEVLDLTNSASAIQENAKELGGYVESSSYSDGNSGYYAKGVPSVSLKLRVPSDKLDDALNRVEGVGTVLSRKLSSEDVTEKYVDIQARLNTKKELRDRLKVLLDRAEEVKDVLAIEKEFSRIQADIDSMEARLKSMKGKVDYASLSVTLQQWEPEPVVVEEIPGPVTYVWNGAVWCVRKLFVWRDAEVIEPEVPERLPGPPSVIEPPASDPGVKMVKDVLYPGETLEDKARQYGISVEQLMSANNLSSPDQAKEGMTLRIPVAE